MRREGGRHSCVTGTKLYGNMTIKNLTSRKNVAARFELGRDDRMPQKKTPYINMRPDPADPDAYSPSHLHSILNEYSVSALCEMHTQHARGIRGRIVRQSHRRERHQLRESVRDTGP